MAERLANRIGVDIGGTFTDLVLMRADGTVFRKKVSSTAEDYSEAILSALGQALDEANVTAGQLDETVHGTTIATNAILELKGARVGLITTRGFRDVLEIRRLRMPKLYQLGWLKPPTLVERYLRQEINERVAADGTIVTPLQEEEVLSVGSYLMNQGVDSIAVAFLNSYANPVHEHAAGRVLREAFPEISISLSVELMPEIQEYERTCTTVVNAYVQPKVQAYLDSLRRRLDEADARAPLLVMQSNGGMIPSRVAGESPVRIIESGPAAGVVGCQQLAVAAGHPNTISFDMGGTTAKASLIENGEIRQATEYEVGGGASMGSRLSRGGGYVVRVPSVDIVEVGAGGGSLVWFDKAGGLQVGPESAGADPGPVCYLNGNHQPTVTDANVVLGYINPSGLAGGSLKINAAAATAALSQEVAARLARRVQEVAFGIHEIANANMIRALRAVTTERGRDPSDFVLYAYGGSGPIHATHIARAMEIGTVVVPLSPGLFSAFGLLLAKVEHHYVRTFLRPLEIAAINPLGDVYQAMEEEARRKADNSEYPLTDVRIRRQADLRFVGQATELTVPFSEGTVNDAALRRLQTTFEEEYERTYGFSAQGETVQIVNLRLVAEGQRPEVDIWRAASQVNQPTERTRRRAYFGPDRGLLDASVVTRGDLHGAMHQGPLIVEEYDSTTIVPPGCKATLDQLGSIVITLEN